MIEGKGVVAWSLQETSNSTNCQNMKNLSRRSEKKPETSLSKAERRKEEVAGAAWEVIAKNGLAGASMREIAQHLGVTVGTLTHYFRNKDQLLELALTGVLKRVSDRLKDLTGTPPISRLMKMVEALLPTDEVRHDNQKVWLTFIAGTFANRALGKQSREGLLALRSSVTEMIIEDREQSGQNPVLSPEDEADLILCFTEGLCVHSIIDKNRFPAERQLALAKEMLTAIHVHSRAS